MNPDADVMLAEFGARLADDIEAVPLIWVTPYFLNSDFTPRSNRVETLRERAITLG